MERSCSERLMLKKALEMSRKQQQEEEEEEASTTKEDDEEDSAIVVAAAKSKSGEVKGSSSSSLHNKKQHRGVERKRVAVSHNKRTSGKMKEMESTTNDRSKTKKKPRRNSKLDNDDDVSDDAEVTKKDVLVDEWLTSGNQYIGSTCRRAIPSQFCHLIPSNSIMALKPSSSVAGDNTGNNVAASSVIYISDGTVIGYKKEHHRTPTLYRVVFDEDVVAATSQQEDDELPTTKGIIRRYEETLTESEMLAGVTSATKRLNSSLTSEQLTLESQKIVVYTNSIQKQRASKQHELLLKLLPHLIISSMQELTLEKAVKDYMLQESEDNDDDDGTGNTDTIVDYNHSSSSMKKKPPPRFGTKYEPFVETCRTLRRNENWYGAGGSSTSSTATGGGAGSTGSSSDQNFDTTDLNSYAFKLFVKERTEAMFPGSTSSSSKNKKRHHHPNIITDASFQGSAIGQRLRLGAQLAYEVMRRVASSKGGGGTTTSVTSDILEWINIFQPGGRITYTLVNWCIQQNVDIMDVAHAAARVSAKDIQQVTEAKLLLMSSSPSSKGKEDDDDDNDDDTTGLPPFRLDYVTTSDSDIDFSRAKFIVVPVAEPEAIEVAEAEEDPQKDETKENEAQSSVKEEEKEGKEEEEEDDETQKKNKDGDTKVESSTEENNNNNNNTMIMLQREFISRQTLRRRLRLLQSSDSFCCIWPPWNDETIQKINNMKKTSSGMKHHKEELTNNNVMSANVVNGEKEETKPMNTNSSKEEDSKNVDDSSKKALDLSASSSLVETSTTADSAPMKTTKNDDDAALAKRLDAEVNNNDAVTTALSQRPRRSTRGTTNVDYTSTGVAGGGTAGLMFYGSTHTMPQSQIRDSLLRLVVKSQSFLTYLAMQTLLVSELENTGRSSLREVRKIRKALLTLLYKEGRLQRVYVTTLLEFTLTSAIPSRLQQLLTIHQSQDTPIVALVKKEHDTSTSTGTSTTTSITSSEEKQRLMKYVYKLLHTERSLRALLLSTLQVSPQKIASMGDEEEDEEGNKEMEDKDADEDNDDSSSTRRQRHGHSFIGECVMRPDGSLWRVISFTPSISIDNSSSNDGGVSEVGGDGLPINRLVKQRCRFQLIPWRSKSKSHHEEQDGDHDDDNDDVVDDDTPRLELYESQVHAGMEAFAVKQVKHELMKKSTTIVSSSSSLSSKATSSSKVPSSSSTVSGMKSKIFTNILLSVAVPSTTDSSKKKTNDGDDDNNLTDEKKMSKKKKTTMSTTKNSSVLFSCTIVGYHYDDTTKSTQVLLLPEKHHDLDHNSSSQDNEQNNVSDKKSVASSSFIDEKVSAEVSSMDYKALIKILNKNHGAATTSTATSPLEEKPNVRKDANVGAKDKSNISSNNNMDAFWTTLTDKGRSVECCNVSEFKEMLDRTSSTSQTDDVVSPPPPAWVECLSSSLSSEKKSDSPTNIKFKIVQWVDGNMPSMQSALDLLQWMKHHPKCGPFLRPVDAVGLGLSDYFDIIQHPMDLSTIERNLKSGKYCDDDGHVDLTCAGWDDDENDDDGSTTPGTSFCGDLLLMLSNAMTYNMEGSWLHSDAKWLREQLKKKINAAIIKLDGGTATTATTKKKSDGRRRSAAANKKAELDNKGSDEEESLDDGWDNKEADDGASDEYQESSAQESDDDDDDDDDDDVMMDDDDDDEDFRPGTKRRRRGAGGRGRRGGAKSNKKHSSSSSKKKVHREDILTNDVIETGIFAMDLLNPSSSLSQRYLPFLDTDSANFSLPDEWRCRWTMRDHDRDTSGRTTSDSTEQNGNVSITTAAATTTIVTGTKSSTNVERSSLVHAMHKLMNSESSFSHLAPSRRSTRNRDARSSSRTGMLSNGGTGGRSNRNRTTDHTSMSEVTNAAEVEYFLGAEPSVSGSDRVQVEVIQETIHEYLSHIYDEEMIVQRSKKGVSTDQDTNNDDDHKYLSLLVGLFHNDVFPPYLGHICPLTGKWEIRRSCVVPALRWVLQGLIRSGHLGADLVTKMTTTTDGGVVGLGGSSFSPSIDQTKLYVSNAYYPVGTSRSSSYSNRNRRPFDMLRPQSKTTTQQQAAEEESSEEELELSEYEKARLDRVARNLERLKNLGLG